MSSAPETGRPKGKMQRLLFVDDSKVIRTIALKILNGHFDTVEAVDGAVAWEILSNDNSISLVVSDLSMPNLNGFDLLERIRTSDLLHLRDIPVIIITGDGDTRSVKDRALAAGATDFIGKPFDSTLLLARTHAHARTYNEVKKLKEENAALGGPTAVGNPSALPTKSDFMKRGGQYLSYSMRHNTRIAILRMEVDGYDVIYQKYGGALAGTIVSAIGNVLSTFIRNEDIATQIDTACFAILIPALTLTHADACCMAERINRDVCTQVYAAGNDRISISISIGITVPEISKDTRLEELLVQAAEQMIPGISYSEGKIVSKNGAPKLAALQPSVNTAPPGGKPEEDGMEIVITAPFSAHLGPRYGPGEESAATTAQAGSDDNSSPQGSGKTPPHGTAKSGKSGHNFFFRKIFKST